MSYENYKQNPPPSFGPQTSSLAVISLISGIASFFIVPVLGALAAIITGSIAKKDIRQSGGRLTGAGLATWGSVLGWINIALGLVAICFIVLAVVGVVSIPVCMLPFTDIFSDFTY